MKNFTFRLTAGCLLVLAFSHLCPGQNRKWDFGVSANYGKDHYNRKYYDTDLWPGTITSYKSNFSLGAGLWAEKHLNSSLSALAELNYYLSNVAENTLCQCSGTEADYYDTSENHNWGSLGTGLRWYLNPKSKVNFFLDGRVKAEYFIADLRKRTDKDILYWHALGYQRFVPSFSMAAGARLNRWTLALTYDRHLARTFTRDIGEHYGYTKGVKTGILRQGLIMKATFAIIKHH